jgi:predicted alpha/beta superfamily hydrolase
VAWREQFPHLDTAHLIPARTIRALLPAGFTPGGSYRTLLMHDGQNLMNPDAAWGGWRMDEALADPAWADVVLLAVDNASDRFEAYTHTIDTIDGEVYGGQASAYLDMLRDVVLPEFRERYGIEAEGDSLMIAGSSLGGLVSLYIAMVDDSLAACVGAMSSSLFWGALDPALDGSQALANLWSTHGTTAIYLDSGGDAVACDDLDGDGIPEEAEDFDNYCETAHLRDVLAGLGYEFDVDLWHWHEPGAEHNEAEWAARVPRMLQACSEGGWSAP